MQSVTAYELRHTFVSITQHLDLSELKSLVGHSAAMDTLGTYAHELDGERQATARKVYDIFIRALEKEKSDHTKEA
jgi:integrase